MAQLALNQAPVNGVTIPTITIPTTTNLSPQLVVTWALNWFLWIAGVIAFAFLIYGGIMFITSGGDAEKTTKARNTILYSVVGIIVIAASYGIVIWANSLIK